MPHLPDHRNHDLLQIAALAAGDAEGIDLEQARELVASCAECASLHHDLRAISAALPATEAPVRSRDFRLTPEQAARLRPAGWRRLLAPLAGPRFAFAAPLGGTLAALGIAGILVAGAASAPLAGVGGGAQREGSSSTTRGMERTTVRLDHGTAEAAASGAPASGEQPAFVAAAPSMAAPQPDANAPEDPQASELPGDTAAGPAPTEPSANGQTGSTSDGGGTGDHPDVTGQTNLETSQATSATDLLASPFATLAAVLLAAGVVLVGARWAARRSG